MKKRTVVVIGGGPAGMMAAGMAAKENQSVVLIEKNRVLGKKLAITGKGRCNITNACDIGEFIGQVPVNASFLYSAFYRFTNEQIIRLLEEWGVPTKVERGGRVFPVSDRAKDVVAALEQFLRRNHVTVVHQTVRRLIIKEQRVIGLELAAGKKYRADSVIVATGGASYPQTGSTGDGYRFAKQAGHTVVSPEPSLVPLVTAEQEPLQGLSLRNIGVKLYRDDAVIYEDFGELLFTHYGVSGPTVLSASSHMRKPGRYRLAIDLKPALSVEELDRRVVRDFETVSRKQFQNALDALLPQKLIPVVIARSGIDPYVPVNQITKAQRQKLVQILKEFTLTITGKRPIAEAIITSGGVSTKEVNASTMESKLVHGLYFAGEVLDVDAYTGGFNLQIAFSTGYLAGIHAGGEETE